MRLKDKVSQAKNANSCAIVKDESNFCADHENFFKMPHSGNNLKLAK